MVAEAEIFFVVENILEQIVEIRTSRSGGLALRALACSMVQTQIGVAFNVAGVHARIETVR